MLIGCRCRSIVDLFEDGSCPVFAPLTARWPILQTNSRGCGYIESQSQTSRTVNLRKVKGIFL